MKFCIVFEFRNICNISKGNADRIDAHSIPMGKLEGNRSLGRHRRRWEDNIKMNLKDVALDAAEINDLEAQDRRKLRAFLIR
jgi:hypothetical protein